MTKWILGLVVLVLVVWGISMPKKESFDDGILTVGAILPLTGPTATFGEIFKRGLEDGLAGDPTIKVIYEDSKGDAAPAVTAFQKLVSVDKVDIVISNLSKASIPLIPLAKDNKVPLIVSLVSALSATSKDNDYVYRLFWTAKQTGDMFADRMIEQKVKSVAVLQAKNEASQSNADVIIPKLEAAGVKITYETFQDADTDFRTQLTRIKAAKPEVFAIISVPAGQWKGIMTQAKELGIATLPITIPIYDVLGVLLNPGTPEALATLADGVYTFTTPFNTGEYRADAKAEFVNKYNKQPEGFVSFGYDAAALLKQLVKDNATGRESVTSYMKNLHSFDGISSPYVIDDSHNIKPTIIRARYINGAVVKSEK